MQDTNKCKDTYSINIYFQAFISDAREIMGAAVQAIRAGFASDDQTKEYVLQATGRIAAVLGKDFAPFVPELLPGLLAALAQRPVELDPRDKIIIVQQLLVFQQSCYAIVVA